MVASWKRPGSGRGSRGLGSSRSWEDGDHAAHALPFHRRVGLDPSPYCAKVEAYLRLAHVPHTKQTSVLRLLRAPRRKLPYIDDHGTIVTDSDNIIRYLKSRYGDPLDEWLTPEGLALGHTVTRMLDDGTYWVGVYSRWMEELAWEIYKPVLFSGIPAPVRSVFAAVVRRDYKRRLDGQGLLRRPRDEIYALGARDVAAIATLLGRNQFLLGPRVSSFDAAVYGFLGNVFYAPIQGPLKDSISHHGELVAYLHRMREMVQLPPSPAPDGHSSRG